MLRHAPGRKPYTRRRARQRVRAIAVLPSAAHGELMRVAAIDLFAGAGGLSIGAVQAGVDVRLLVDFDPMMCRTLELNPEWHPGVVLEHDVATLSGDELREAAKLTTSDLLLVVG